MGRASSAVIGDVATRVGTGVLARPAGSALRIRMSRSNHGVKSERKFTVLIKQDEGGYFVATLPGLRGCHTQAKTLDTLMKRIREAISLCLDEEPDAAAPLELIGIQQIWL